MRGARRRGEILSLSGIRTSIKVGDLCSINQSVFLREPICAGYSKNLENYSTRVEVYKILIKLSLKSAKSAIDLTSLAEPSFRLRPLRGIGLTDQLLILVHLRVFLRTLILNTSTILLVEYFDDIIAEVVLHVSLVALGLLGVHWDVVV